MSTATEDRQRDGGPPDDRPDDERVVQMGWLRRLLLRPEVGALIGTLAVFAFFRIFDEKFTQIVGVSRFLDPAATLGIMAVAVALLMIGGEFDLSAGVTTASSGILLGLLTAEWGWNIWPALAVVFLFAAVVGFVNGYLVVRTGLPSFIVTLATFFVLRGTNVGLTKQITGQVRVADIDSAGGYESARKLFGSQLGSAPEDFNVRIFWWIALMVLATWVLTRTRVGNWIFGVGGDQVAARNVGVPVVRTKIGLFVATSLACALAGVMTAIQLTSVQADQGVGEEFNYIVAAVVGGCLLTGGFGSAIGAALGSLIIGMAFIGISFAGWNTDWRYLFLGVILFLAVLVNSFVGRRAAGARR
jgi:simple sugar transport system permease protein